MREILLTRGLVTIVDDEDYAWASKLSWSAVRGRHEAYYASRGVSERMPDGTVHRYTRQLQRNIMDPDRLLPRTIKVDHINGDTLDNRRGNLRLCSDSDSNANRRMPNKSGIKFKGVWRDPKGRAGKEYWVFIKRGGRMYYGKRQPDVISAAREYNRLALELHGEFARLNVMPGDMP